MKHFIVLSVGLLMTLSAQGQPGGTFPRGDALNPADLLCVSRDNDGSNPYLIAQRDPRDLSITRLKDLGFTKAECERALGAIRTAGDGGFLCASRDKDGLHPFTIYALNNGLRSVARKIGSYRDVSSCEQALWSARLSPTHFVICSSRDNDGLRPFLRVSYSLADRTLDADTTVLYRSMQECLGAN